MSTNTLVNEPTSVMIREYWTLIVRRKWLVLSMFLIGVTIAAVLCVVLPKSYRSSTSILIEDQKIPDDYVKGIGGASIQERLTTIQQQVMSRTLLSQIIDEFKLYEGQVKRIGLESAIEGMRKDIKVETVGTTGARGKSVEAVTISFAHEHPMTAMQVTAKLASLFIEENLKVREQLVTGVSVFLEQELHEAKTALEAQERAISSYKTRYMGLLPEQLEANLRGLDRLQTNLHTTDEQWHNETEKLSALEKSIKEYQASGSTLALPGTPAPGDYSGRDPLVQRLREVERQLTTLTATDYKSTYPDIVEAKQEIESLKMQLAEKYGDPAAETDKDPAKTYDSYLQELIKQKIALRTEVASLQERSRRLTAQIREFEHRVEQTPSREQEVMILMRDYENMQKNYQALLDKRLNAHVAENLEKRQKGEQFRILDPANLPQKLDSPNRLLIMILGVIGGCGFGVSLAVGRDRLFPTFKRRQEVETLPGIRVLATIPDFVTMYDYPDVKLPLENSRARRTSAHRAEALLAYRNLVAKWQPFSMAAEQYRMAATSLVLATERSNSTIVEITSSLKGEGKTTTVVNLGYTLAKNLGKRTLLIDCDFRCPALHHYASVPARAGLIELLDDQALFEDCISVIDEVPCSILSVGGASGEDHNELTRIQQLREILPKLRKHYEYILINTPPVLQSATMGILASLADVLIMVIRAGTTPKHIVQQAFKMLRLNTEALVILNAVETQSLPGYVYYDNLMPPSDGQSIKARPRKIVPLAPVNDIGSVENPKPMNVPSRDKSSGW